LFCHENNVAGLPIGGEAEMQDRLAAAAFVAGVVSSSTVLFGQSSMTPSAAQSSTTPSSAQTFNICMGGFWNPQKENKCEAYDIYVFCLNPDNPPYKRAAKNACKEAGKSGNFTAQTLRYVPDNRCGYTNIRITCK
jgi:hypothetical protein